MQVGTLDWSFGWECVVPSNDLVPVEFEKKLFRSGRLVEFKKRFAFLVAEGAVPGAAYVQARREIENPDENPPGPTEPDPGNPARNQASQYLADAEWVYNNIGNDNVVPEDAPSPGAWWFLTISRDDPKMLRDAMVLIAKRSEVDATESAIQKDCVRTRDELMKTMERIKHTVLPKE